MRAMSSLSDGSEASPEGWLWTVLPEAREVVMTSAYLTLAGLELVQAPLRAALLSGAEVVVVSGGRRDQVDVRALEALLALERSFPGQMQTFIVPGGASMLTAKSYGVRTRTDAVHAWIGSANLTRAGLSRNLQTGVVFAADHPGDTDYVAATKILSDVHAWRSAPEAVRLTAEIKSALRLTEPGEPQDVGAALEEVIDFLEGYPRQAVPGAPDEATTPRANEPERIADPGEASEEMHHPGVGAMRAPVTSPTAPALKTWTTWFRVCILDSSTSSPAKRGWESPSWRVTSPVAPRFRPECRHWSCRCRRALERRCKRSLPLRPEFLCASCPQPRWTMRTGRESPGRCRRSPMPPLYLSHQGRFTIEEIRRRIRDTSRLEERSVAVVVVDSIASLVTEPGRRFSGREQEIGHLAVSLKALAVEEQVAVVTTSGLTRGPQQRTDKRPILSDVRDSTQVVESADVVILIHREDMHERESPRAGEADLIVAKSRNSPLDTLTVAFQGHYSRFVDMAS